MRTEFNKELRRRQYLILRDLPFFFFSSAPDLPAAA